MFRKYLTTVLAVLILNLGLSLTVLATTNDPKLAKHAEKVKTNIAKLGIGREARVEVKMRDKTKLKGYVSRIDEKSFFVIDDKSGVETEVAYQQAKQVKGNNLATGVKIAIAVGIILAIAAIAALCCS